MNTYTCARLTTGQIVPLRKDCECITHAGPHWLYADASWRKANRLPDSPSMLALYGHAQEEIARLRELRWAMEREGIAQLLTDEDLTALRASGEAVDVSRPGLKPHLRRAIQLSYIEAQRQFGGGRTWEAYVALWEWCSVRLGGSAARKHDQFVDRFGYPAYYARINRVRKACGFAPIG